MSVDRYLALSRPLDSIKYRTFPKGNVFCKITNWEQAEPICPRYHFQPITDRKIKNSFYWLAWNDPGIVLFWFQRAISADIFWKHYDSNDSMPGYMVIKLFRQLHRLPLPRSRNCCLFPRQAWSRHETRRSTHCPKWNLLHPVELERHRMLLHLVLSKHKHILQLSPICWIHPGPDCRRGKWTVMRWQ